MEIASVVTIIASLGCVCCLGVLSLKKGVKHFHIHFGFKEGFDLKISFFENDNR